jgi:hypothetical protein
MQVNFNNCERIGVLRGYNTQVHFLAIHRALEKLGLRTYEGRSQLRGKSCACRVPLLFWSQFENGGSNVRR